MKRFATVVVLVACVAGLSWTSSIAAPTFDAINGTAIAAADHISAGTDAFPNFATGAVDNRYPLAFSHVDTSSSEGLSSPLDTGPLGQTGAATAGVQQPQYADAKYPPKPQTATFGEQGGPYSYAHAEKNSANASSTTESSPGAIPTSKRSASFRRLNRALLDWRGTFLTADDKKRFPFRRADASDPDGAAGLSAITRSAFDEKTGVLTVDSDSRIAHASFGGGAIRFADIQIHVTITSSGTPKETVTADVGSASVGGVPVTVGANGLSVAGTEVPGLAGAAGQASAALSDALKSAGFTVGVVSPVITKTEHQETVEASAVRVRWDSPKLAPGVPTEFVQHDLGSAYAFSLASPSTALTPTTPTGTEGTPGTPPTTHFVPGTPGTEGTPGTTVGDESQGAPSQALGGVRTTSSKPLWLLLMYFAWQSTLIGAAASLWWWRKGDVR